MPFKLSSGLLRDNKDFMDEWRASEGLSRTVATNLRMRMHTLQNTPWRTSAITSEGDLLRWVVARERLLHRQFLREQGQTDAQPSANDTHSAVGLDLQRAQPTELSYVFLCTSLVPSENPNQGQPRPKSHPPRRTIWKQTLTSRRRMRTSGWANEMASSR